ncbi:MAG: hypothetical protein MZV70_61005 [Desulfobacterales bacterium]|nr:hypothetical protein [Desulfobacterales bacterium]
MLAHLTHVRGTGTYAGGVERPDVDLVLATAIPEEVCRRINVGYMDPAAIRLADYMNQEDAGDPVRGPGRGDPAPPGTAPHPGLNHE